MSQKSGADTSFLTTMKNVLSSVNTESSAINTTIGNINFQASKNENNVTRLQWIYVEYDTIMNRKRVEIEFKKGDLETFRDTWSLYKVAGPNVLSAEQARKIALDAAHKLLLNISTGDGKIETIKAPDLSNALYDVQFSMSPCQGQVAKELSLDPFTLYPFWHFNFYFNETIAGAEGIQVGVLGDTGAVFSTGIFGYLGNPTTANGTPTITSATNTSLDLVLIAAATTALMLIVSVPIALRHKIRQRK